MAEKSLTRKKFFVTVEGHPFPYVIRIPPSVVATVGSESIVGLKNLFQTSCGLDKQSIVGLKNLIQTSCGLDKPFASGNFD